MGIQRLSRSIESLDLWEYMIKMKRLVKKIINKNVISH